MPYYWYPPKENLAQDYEEKFGQKMSEEQKKEK
jgi:hypothetical protein